MVRLADGMSAASHASVRRQTSAACQACGVWFAHCLIGGRADSRGMHPRAFFSDSVRHTRTPTLDVPRPCMHVRRCMHAVCSHTAYCHTSAGLVWFWYPLAYLVPHRYRIGTVPSIARGPQSSTTRAGSGTQIDCRRTHACDPDDTGAVWSRTYRR